MQDEADAQLKWVRENMSDTIPDEAFPERMKVFSRHRKMTFNDHVNRDPVDWCDYIRKDISDAAVKAERERCAQVAETCPFSTPWVAAAIRQGEQP
jgi:transcriptional regulator GlxA family with amidase domain